MRKTIPILISLFFALGLSACAKPPLKPAGASQEEQRGHAREAQGELSSEVHK